MLVWWGVKMVNPTLSDDILKNYANGGGEAILTTLSVQFGDEVPTYIWLGEGDIILPLENGENVTFTGLPFRFNLPSTNDESETYATLQISGVSNLLTPIIRTALENGKDILVCYREYLSDSLSDGPCNRPALKLVFNQIIITDFIIEGRITSAINGASRFPKEIYTTDRFPALTY